MNKGGDMLKDLYRDLRDRRLLPVVIALAVAIVAVPFLLGGGSEPVPPTAPAATVRFRGTEATSSRRSSSPTSRGCVTTSSASAGSTAAIRSSSR